MDEPDWNEAPLQRWMGSITKESTKGVYQCGFRRYAEYTGTSATALVDEALEDVKRDPREKRDIVKQRLIGFYNWLVKEAPRRRGGRQGSVVVGRGLSSKISHTYVNAVRSFYGTFDVYVKLKGRSKLPRARVENRRMIVANTAIRRLVDHAGSPRDRAMILTMFQGGMDVSTLCSLRQGDVAGGLDRDEHPLKLELFRQKSGTEFYTFLGKDACEAIRAYLNVVRDRGVRLAPATPLFLKGRHMALKGEGITTNLVQSMMRVVAVKSGLVDRDNNGKAFNPLSPHALRESFGSIMTNSGVPDTIVDFWLGHSLGEMAEAYKVVQYDSLREMYLERERLLSISQTPVDVQEIERKIETRIDAENRQLQSLVNGLTAENLDLQRRTRVLERRQRETQRSQAEHQQDIGALRGENDQLTERLNSLIEGRGRVDEMMERIIYDPEVKTLLTRKLRELSSGETA